MSSSFPVIQDCDSNVDQICIQETRNIKAQEPFWRARLWRSGWRVFFEPALVTADQGKSGGLATLVRRTWQVPIEDPVVVWPARTLSTPVLTRKFGVLRVINVYFESGGGLTKAPTATF